MSHNSTNVIYFQIGSLADHYLFEHPHVHKRHIARNLEHHEKLSSHPHVSKTQILFLIHYSFSSFGGRGVRSPK